MKKLELNGFTLTQIGENVWNVFQDFFEAGVYDRDLVGTPQECSIIAHLEKLCMEKGIGRDDLYYVLFEHDDHPILRAFLRDIETNPKYVGIELPDLIEDAKKMAKEVLSDLKVRECFNALKG